MPIFAPINVLSLRNGEGRGVLLRPQLVILTSSARPRGAKFVNPPSWTAWYLPTFNVKERIKSPEHILLPDAIKTLTNNVDLVSTLNHYERGKLHNLNQA